MRFLLHLSVVVATVSQSTLHTLPPCNHQQGSDANYKCTKCSHGVPNQVYSHQSLTSGCPICNANPVYGVPNDDERAVAYCKTQCSSNTVCQGFAYRKHGNGHEVCQYYNSGFVPWNTANTVTTIPGSRLCQKISALRSTPARRANQSCSFASLKVHCSPYMSFGVTTAMDNNVDDCRAGCLASSLCFGISWRAGNCKLWTAHCLISNLMAGSYYLETKACAQYTCASSASWGSCPVGFSLKTSASTITCATACSQSLCCEVANQATCGSYSCPTGFSSKSSSSTISCGYSCSTAQCCQVASRALSGSIVGTCASYNCPSGYSSKSSPSTISCGSSCGTAQCCGPQSCVLFTCPTGYTRISSYWRISCGSYCSTADCCQRFQNCASYICPLGYTSKSNPSTISCGYFSCSMFDCCRDLNCGSYTCPTGYSAKSSPSTISCYSSSCGSFDCCDWTVSGSGGGGGGGGGGRSAVAVIVVLCLILALCGMVGAAMTHRGAPQEDPVPPATACSGATIGRNFDDVVVRSESEELRKNIIPEKFAESVPKYWNNSDYLTSGFNSMLYVPRGNQFKFNRLLSSTYKAMATQDRPCPKNVHGKTKGGCPCVQPGGDPGLPSEFRVRRVIRVEDSGMWLRYVKKKQKICNQRQTDELKPPVWTDKVADEHPEDFDPLDNSCNECYLWHGTSTRAALSIAQNDFRIDLSGSNAGNMYGRGAYLGESSTKADEYANDEPNGFYAGIFAMLLCRVVLGKSYYTTDRDEQADSKVKGGEYDSVVGDRLKAVGTYREFVVMDADQVYPEYLVFYSRIHEGDDKEMVERSFAQDFHMELPISWSNCCKDPMKDPFHDQYVVLQSTRMQIQALVDKTYIGGKAVIKRARRIENSIIWNKYVAFKMQLGEKLARRQSEEDETHARGTNPVFRIARANIPGVEDLDGKADFGRVLTLTSFKDNDPASGMSTTNLETSMKEYLLWHGTSKSAAEAIVKEDFKIPVSQAAHGQRFGSGAYFAEQFDKSLAYCRKEPGGTCYVLLCRVCLGEIYYTEERVDKDAHSAAIAAGRTAVVANPEGIGPREFIVIGAEQVYPEYLLELQLLIVL